MTTNTQDKLFNLLYRAKSPWEVMPITHSPCLPGAELTIQRCLALRHLELPVGEWITNASKREAQELGDNAMSLLASNIKDEDRHSKQLNRAFENLKFCSEEQVASIEHDAKSILNRWLEAADKYHPALVAFVGEAGCFMPSLTAMRRLGGMALVNCSNEIQRDESIHCRSHKEVAMGVANQKITSELDKLRADTVDWVFQDLKTSGIPGKYAKKRTYLQASKKLVYNGIAEEFTDTKKSVQIAFFETSNANIPVYST